MLLLSINSTTIGLCACVGLLIVTRMCYLACIAVFLIRVQQVSSLSYIIKYINVSHAAHTWHTLTQTTKSNVYILLDVFLMCLGLSTQDLWSFGFCCTLCNSRRSRHLWHQLDLWRGASGLGKGKDLRVEHA